MLVGQMRKVGTFFVLYDWGYTKAFLYQYRHMHCAGNKYCCDESKSLLKVIEVLAV